MVYCTSDIHGNYLSYSTLLKLIDFSDEDVLYVVGDVVDFGFENMKVLFDMMERPNVIPLLGEHDYMAYYSLKWLKSNVYDKNKLVFFDYWTEVGGTPVWQEFTKLSYRQKRAVISYLGKFSLCKSVNIGEKEFVMIHRIPNGFSPEKTAGDYKYYDFITGETDYQKTYFPDKYLVTGHTLTSEINEQMDGLDLDTIFIGNNHIALNCGNACGGVLGAICLDTFEEFYT